MKGNSIILNERLGAYLHEGKRMQAFRDLQESSKLASDDHTLFWDDCWNNGEVMNCVSSTERMIFYLRLTEGP